MDLELPYRQTHVLQPSANLMRENLAPAVPLRGQSTTATNSNEQGHAASQANDAMQTKQVGLRQGAKLQRNDF